MSEVRLPRVITQPLSEGEETSARASTFFVEPLTEGLPNARASTFYVEPLIEGYPNARLSLMTMQALFPVAEEFIMPDTPFPGFGNSTIDPSIPAAANPASTALPGLSFNVVKRPMFKGKIDEASSGNEVRTSYTEWPRWEFELNYEFLEDRSGAESSLKTILGFFTDMKGSFLPWLFKDPDDYLVTKGVMGVADGVTTEFYFRRYIGTSGEPIGRVDEANDIDVYANNVLVNPSEYTLGHNSIVFDSAPADTVVITASFQFFFVCRFMEDEMDFEKFMDRLWSLQSCSFKSILT